jgi:hypothetical protein
MKLPDGSSLEPETRNEVGSMLQLEPSSVNTLYPIAFLARRNAPLARNWNPDQKGRHNAYALEVLKFSGPRYFKDRRDIWLADKPLPRPYTWAEVWTEAF